MISQAFFFQVKVFGYVIENVGMKRIFRGGDFVEQHFVNVSTAGYCHMGGVSMVLMSVARKQCEHGVRRNLFDMGS
jgi:hypothetical protein